MRQIHAAIEHLRRGDFECAITLAAAGEGILPPTDKPIFREKINKVSKELSTLQGEGVTGANDIINWLKHGEIRDGATGQHKRYETATIEEFEAIVTIYRAITKFEAVFEDQKTPQMLGFKKWAGSHLQNENEAHISK